MCRARGRVGCRASSISVNFRLTPSTIIFLGLATQEVLAEKRPLQPLVAVAVDSVADFAPDVTHSSLVQLAIERQPRAPLQHLQAPPVVPASLRQTAAAVESAATARVALPPVAGEAIPPAGGSTVGLFTQLHFSATGTLAAYLATACLTAGAIVVLYWPRGAAVICRIIVYLLALSTMKLSVKLIFVDYGFNYPKFLTGVHFASSVLVAFGIMLYRQSAPAPAEALLTASGASTKESVASADVKRHLASPTAREFWQMIVPIAMSFSLSVAANNVALMYSTAAFTEIVGATSPVVSIGLIILMGMPFDARLLWPTLLVVAGCALSTSGEVRFSAMGMACCVVSMVSRALKSTLQQRVLTGDSKAKFDPVTLMAWMCIPSFAVMLLWSLSVEGIAPFVMMQEHPHRLRLALCIIASCANATILNLSNLFCVKDLGAVGVQLIAQMKSVLTVLGAVALFHEAVTPMEVGGFVGVLIGVFLFSHMEQKAKKVPT